MLSTKEAAALLGISERRVRHYAEIGRLPAHYVGSRLIFSERDIKQFQRYPVGRPCERQQSWQIKQTTRLVSTLTALPKHLPGVATCFKCSHSLQIIWKRSVTEAEKCETFKLLSAQEIQHEEIEILAL